MKKFSDVMVSFFVVVLLVLASPFIFIFFILKSIRDYIKYKKSMYYQDTHERYSWMCGESEHITFYNAVKKENLPIDYYRFNALKMTGYGYFIYDENLILCDYDSDICFFDNDKKEWFVNDEHDYVTLESAVNDEIIKVNEFIGKNVCKQAIIFVESEMYSETTEKHYDNIKFLSITDGDKISALKIMAV